MNVFEQNINLKDFLKTKNVFQKNLKSKSTNSIASNKESKQIKKSKHENQNNEGKKCTMITTVEFFPKEQNVVNEFDVAKEETEREKLKDDIKKLMVYEELTNQKTENQKSMKLEDILIQDLDSYNKKLNQINNSNKKLEIEKNIENKQIKRQNSKSKDKNQIIFDKKVKSQVRKNIEI